MSIWELSMCDADREALGGPEWLRLDTDRLLDTPAKSLIRWEAETRYPIERAYNDIQAGAIPASAVLVLLWVARKQMGADGGGIDEDTGHPEVYARLADVKTMRVQIRSAREPDPEPGEGDDALPPENSPAT